MCSLCMTFVILFSVSICSALEGHMIETVFLVRPYLTHSFKEFHESWLKCSVHWDNVQKAGVSYIGWRSRVTFVKRKCFSNYLENSLTKFNYCQCVVSALSVYCQCVSSILPVYWSSIARPDYRLAIKTSLKPVCDQFDVRSDNKLNIHWLHTGFTRKQ